MLIYLFRIDIVKLKCILVVYLETFSMCAYSVFKNLNVHICSYNSVTAFWLIMFVSIRFVGGKLNMCYNAVDCHVESGRGEQPAVIYDSPVTGIKQIITFRELQDQVNSIFKSRSHRA